MIRRFLSYTYGELPPKYKLGYIGTIMACSATYAYGTQFEQEIRVDQKFMRVVGGENWTSHVFTVSDTHNNIYNVKRSYWYWQMYPTELWNQMRPNNTYKVKGYGIRIGLLNVYPNIISAQLVNPGPESSVDKIELE